MTPAIEAVFAVLDRGQIRHRLSSDQAVELMATTLRAELAVGSDPRLAADRAVAAVVAELKRLSRLSPSHAEHDR